MSEQNAPLLSCENEPIHIPGKIQSHGFLIALDKKSFIVSHLSTNLNKLLPGKLDSYLNKHLDVLMAGINALKIESGLSFSQLIITAEIGEAGLGSVAQLLINEERYNFIVNHAGDKYLVELDPLILPVNTTVEKTLGSSIAAILEEPKLLRMLQRAAAEVKHIIGYDRVMIYRFDEDGHGEVIAEEREEALEPFLGLHYPASDIPKQARELYKKNLTRIIADVDAVCPDILTTEVYQPALDLTNSVLRAVSPVHIEYLKNLGVCSSFSISLISNGELWGLIACHNYTPLFINYRARENAKLIGQILSPTLEFKIGEENITRNLMLGTAVNALIRQMDTLPELTDALTQQSVTIKDITYGSGALIIYNNQNFSFGAVPGENEIKELLAWLHKEIQEPVFTTDKLPVLFPPAKAYRAVGSGLLACTISKDLGEFMLFFKPEIAQTVSWGGNPAKVLEVAAGSTRLTPRKSFEKYIETVELHSEKWSNAELTAVANVREHILFHLTRKTNEIRLLNEKLKNAYEELDAFSYTISHDLRSPLTALKGYGQILMNPAFEMQETAKGLVEKMNGSVNKMEFMIKEILNYASLAQGAINFASIDMENLLEELKAEVMIAYPDVNLQFLIEAAPQISGDYSMVNQIFTNLITNAVKYSSKSNPAVVKINGVVVANEIIYCISDNGIGIEPEFFKDVFHLFKRLGNVTEVEGTGVGLAIVKRLIDKHGGRIWLDSKKGRGTSFYVAFNKGVAAH